MNKDINTLLNKENKENKPPRYKFSKLARAILSGLCLAIVATGCVECILQVNSATQNIITKNENNGVKNRISALLPPEAQGSGVKLTCYTVNKDKYIGHNQKLFVAAKDIEILGYVLTYSTSLGYSDPLVMIAGFTKDKKVYKADIHFSQETPGLGDKVDREHGNFLDQFSGLGLSDANWDVKKHGGDFDFITGSTVTSRATVIATSNALKSLENIDISTLKKCKVN